MSFLFNLNEEKSRTFRLMSLTFSAWSTTGGPLTTSSGPFWPSLWSMSFCLVSLTSFSWPILTKIHSLSLFARRAFSYILGNSFSEHFLISSRFHTKQGSSFTFWCRSRASCLFWSLFPFFTSSTSADSPTSPFPKYPRQYRPSFHLDLLVVSFEGHLQWVGRRGCRSQLGNLREPQKLNWERKKTEHFGLIKR